MTDSYYDEISCPFRPESCTINHRQVNREKWREVSRNRISVGKRLIEGAKRATYFLYFVPYGCFGDLQAASDNGEIIVTTDPKKHFGGDGPVIFVDDYFLNTTPHVLVDELI